MTETDPDRLKRMTMRSWRRGTKEMDLILGPYAEAELAGMDPSALDAYDALLAENDQDLIGWILGQTAPPEALGPQISVIAAFARRRLGPQA